MSILDTIIQSSNQYSSRSVCNFFDSELTYSELMDAIKKLAVGLQQKLGVKKGTKVGIYLPNIPAYIISYYAVFMAGGIVVNYSLLSSTENFHQQVLDSKIEVLITLNLKKLFEPALQIQQHKNTNFKLVVCSFFEVISYWKDWIFWFKQYNNIASINYDDISIFRFKNLLKCGNNIEPVKINEEDLAFIQFSGGTTGESKGVLLTHANILSCFTDIEKLIKPYHQGENATVLTVLPLNHIFSLLITLYLAKTGFCAVLVPKFEAAEIIDLISKGKLNFMIFVPSLLGAIAYNNKIKNCNFSNLRLIFCGGSLLTKKLYDEITKYLPKNCDLFQGYGLTESCALIAVNNKDFKENPESVGYPVSISNISIRSLKNDKNELNRGEIGEICVNGPQVMQSYLQNKNNKNVFIDKYLKTGDIGYLSSDGKLYVIDRIKDMIIRRGYNIFPSEIEKVINQHPAVEIVAVLGVKNTKINEEFPKAVIKLRSNYLNTNPNEIRDSILEHCHKHLSALKMPKIIEFVDDLPKTAVGKIDKKKLKLKELEESNIRIN